MRKTLGGFRLTLGLAAASLLGIVSTAGAQITNGDFASGTLSGYTATGNVSVQSVSTIGEAATNTSGSVYEALLSNATPGGGSGAPVSASSLETTLGLAAGTYTSQSYVNGSALQLTFSAAAGDNLSFDANFLTNEGVNEDAAYAYLVGPGNTFIPLGLTNGLIGDTSTATSPTSALDTEFNNMTGYFSPDASVTLATSGTYTLEFAVLNQNNTSVASGLLVDNIVLSPNTGAPGSGGSAVPLPAAGWVGLLGGLLAVGFGLRMRRQTNAA